VALATLLFTAIAGAANGDSFILGSSANSATAATSLSTSGSPGLAVSDTTGSANALSGTNSASSGTGAGVYGKTQSASANAAGVFGQISSSADYSAGVRGQNDSASCCGFGVVGFAAGQGIGIGGYAPNGFGVFGWSPNNWAAWFDGSVQVTGTLYKGAGAFRIDNPVDPAHSYLQHSFVESPQMKNVYDGVVRTDGRGFAVVRLPRWFQALNRDFRYQLTVLGRSFARAIVWDEVAHNRFTIRTNEPHVQVSWQVTGVRHDAYARAHPIPVVLAKTGAAEGTFLHPELYGKPRSKSVVPPPRPGGRR
jgi:hypothetical protein